MIFGGAEIKRLEAELELAKQKLEVSERKLFEENAEREKLKAELEHARKLYTSEKAAREKQNGCVRGEYCNQCKHGVMVPRYADGTGLKCVCTYGTCPHFEKEDSYEPDN